MCGCDAGRAGPGLSRCGRIGVSACVISRSLPWRRRPSHVVVAAAISPIGALLHRNDGAADPSIVSGAGGSERART